MYGRKFDEPRDLDLARTAPGGPEVEQHHLAAVIGEMDSFAGGIREREIHDRLLLDAGAQAYNHCRCCENLPDVCAIHRCGQL